MCNKRYAIVKIIKYFNPDCYRLKNCLQISKKNYNIRLYHYIDHIDLKLY